MTAFEALSLIGSCLAALISLVVWFGQRKLQQEAIEMQRAVSRLAEKQLEILTRDERNKSSARLSLSLIKDGKTFRFKLTNIGDVDAFNVEMKLLIPNPSDSPLIDSEYHEKFPAKRLGPGTSVTLIAALGFGSRLAYNAELKWANPDGSVVTEETYAAL